MLYYLFSSLHLFAALNVVYLTPNKENIYPLDALEYNVFYIATRAEGIHDPKKTIGNDRICTVKDYDDIDGMISCIHAFTKKLEEKKPFDFLIDNGTELGVDIASQLRTKFGVKFGLTAERAKYFLDKKDMKQKLKEKYPSLLTAPFITFPEKTNLNQFKNTILTQLKLPVMIKQLDGHASIGVYLVEDAKKLDQVSEEILYQPEAYLAEEFIPGRVLRIDGHTIKGNIEAIYYSYYGPSCYDFYNYGQPQITYSDRSKDISSVMNFTAKILDAFDYSDGMFHLEAIEHQETKELYFLEIAVRPGADSDFLMKLFNYNYSYIYWQFQLRKSVIDSQHKTMQEGDDYAVVDCPTLPYKEGEWAFQTLAQKPSYIIPKNSSIFMMNVPDIDEEYKLESAPTTFMHAGFKGKHAFEHATTFVKSIRASFYVAQKPGQNGRLVDWPLDYPTKIDKKTEPAPKNKEQEQTSKREVEKPKQSCQHSDDKKRILQEIADNAEESRKRKREEHVAPQPVAMPEWKKHLMSMPMGPQIKQEQCDSPRQVAQTSQHVGAHTQLDFRQKKRQELIKILETELKKGNGISVMFRSGAITSKSGAEALIKKTPHLKKLDEERRGIIQTPPQKRQKLTED